MRQILNLMIVWACTGLWHGGAWNFLIWGLYYFFILTLEKLFLLDFVKLLPDKFGKTLGRIYTLAAVFFGWVIFVSDDLESLASVPAALVGIGVELISEPSIFILLSSAALLAVCAIASTHYPSSVLNRLLRGCSVDTSLGVRGTLAFAVLFFSIVFLVCGSYNPFLYFMF